jgi:beta-glucosidase
VPAIVDMWLPGEGGAAALADVLLGKTDPSGRLPVTFPVRSEDDPTDLRSAKSAYSEGLLVGYRGFAARGVKPLFPFGHGLSYTSFAWSGFTAPARVTGDKPVTLRLTVRNTGARSGKEVVQVYVAPAEPGAGDPPLALRGFAKLSLAPGARRIVTIVLDPRAFSAWDETAKAWRVRPGRYRLMVGASSADIRAVREVEVLAPTTGRPR